MPFRAKLHRGTDASSTRVYASLLRSTAPRSFVSCCSGLILFLELTIYALLFADTMKAPMEASKLGWLAMFVYADPIPPV